MYICVDRVYVKAGLEREKAAVLMVMAALSDGRKTVVSAVPGYRGSTESWTDVLRNLKHRGLECTGLVVGNGHLGIWGALRTVYPQAAEQRCWNHKILNVLDRLPKRQQEEAKRMLRRIPPPLDSGRGAAALECVYRMVSRPLLLYPGQGPVAGLRPPDHLP